MLGPVFAVAMYLTTGSVAAVATPAEAVYNDYCAPTFAQTNGLSTDGVDARQYQLYLNQMRYHASCDNF
jgi:hypothetical protein